MTRPVLTENHHGNIFTTYKNSPKSLKQTVKRKSSDGKVETKIIETFTGGYEKQNIVDTIPGRLICLICSMVMRNPIQTSGGNLACQTCYDWKKKESSNEQVFDTDEGGDVFPDRATANEIGKLSSRCGNVEFGCQWQGIVKELDEHQSSCCYSPSKCFYCHETIKDLHAHLTECPHITSLDRCPYKGCDFRVNEEADLITHIKDYAFFHMALHEPEIQQMKEETEHLNKNLKKTKEEFEKATKEQEKKITKLSDSLIVLQEQLKSIQEQYCQFGDTKTEKGSTKKTDDSSDSTEVATMAGTVDVLDKSVNELNLRQKLLENTCYDGRLLWKIDNFRDRQTQAKEGSMPALHSAPCFTKRYGYKFCARLYPHGDGEGKGKHLSLFFVLMKSEYDNVNTFPFTHRVSFRLISQTNRSKDKIEAFSPDVTLNSFKQPERSMNVAAGCPQFISFADLENENNGYVKDDTIFIEIHVTPK